MRGLETTGREIRGTRRAEVAERRAGRARVLLVGPLHPRSGGVATVTRTLLGSELGCRFDLLHYDISNRGGIAQQGHFRARSFSATARQVTAFDRLLRRARPDLVHLPVSGTLSGFLRDGLFVRLAAGRGVPVVGHVHGARFAALYDEGSPVVRALVRDTFRRIDRTIALSPILARFFPERGLTDRVTVVPNAVDEEFLSLLPERVPVERPGSGGFHVLFVGALKRDKGVFDLLAAAAEVVSAGIEARFTLIGPEAEPGIVDRLVAASRLEGIAEAVHFPGPRFGWAKVAAFLDADVLCLPSYHEAFPCTILEGMAAGLPIASTTVAGIPDLVQEEANGLLVPPGDVPGLAGALARLAAEPALRRAMGERNAAEARSQYAVPVVVERIASLYRELLA